MQNQQMQNRENVKPAVIDLSWLRALARFPPCKTPLKIPLPPPAAVTLSSPAPSAAAKPPKAAPGSPFSKFSLKKVAEKFGGFRKKA